MTKKIIKESELKKVTGGEYGGAIPNPETNPELHDRDFIQGGNTANGGAIINPIPPQIDIADATYHDSSPKPTGGKINR